MPAGQKPIRGQVHEARSHRIAIKRPIEDLLSYSNQSPTSRLAHEIHKKGLDQAYGDCGNL